MNSQDNRHKARRVSVQEFGEYLNAKGIRQECPECGQGNSAINILNNDVGVVNYPLAKVDADGSLEDARPFSMPVLSISCENCGYTRTFTLPTVMRWLDERHDKKDGSDE